MEISCEPMNVRFGSQVALQSYISRMSALGRKADGRKCRFRESLAERLLSPIADVEQPRNHRN